VKLSLKKYVKKTCWRKNIIVIILKKTIAKFIKKIVIGYQKAVNSDFFYKNTNWPVDRQPFAISGGNMASNQTISSLWWECYLWHSFDRPVGVACQTSYGSGSKNFDPGQVGSIFWGSGQIIGFGKFPLKTSNFLIFFPLDQKIDPTWHGSKIFDLGQVGSIFWGSGRIRIWKISPKNI